MDAHRFLVVLASVVAIALSTHALVAAAQKPQTGEAVVRTAKSFVAAPYGSVVDGQVIDCPGLVQHVFRMHGLTLPRSARDQALLGVAVSRTELRAGDLVFFSREPGGQRAQHVGIATGDGRIVHASGDRLSVVVDSLDSRYFQQRWVTARRILPETAEAALVGGAPRLAP